MTKTDIAKIERYLKKLFGNAQLTVRTRPRKTDSAEVYIGEEFVGVISEDKEEGETSYHLQVAILEIDLED